MNSMNFDTDEELQAAIADEIIDPEVMADFENTAVKAGLSHEQMQTVWNWMVKGAVRLLSETKRKLEDYPPKKTLKKALKTLLPSRKAE